MSRATAKKVRIERKDNVSLLGPVNSVEVASESKLRAFARAVADGGFPLVPLGLRKKRQQRLNLRGKRRRSDNPAQYTETGAVRAFHSSRDGLRAVHKQRPSLDFSKLRHRLRAIRVVKIQDRSLREHVRRANAGWMIGVAFDLRRPTFVALHEQANRIRAKRHRGGIKLRLAEGHSIGLLDVRHDVLLRRSPAAGKSRKSQRCRHQLQEIAPVDRVVPLGRRLPRKFTMQQILKFGIAGELLERAPILLPSFELKLGAYGGQIQRAFAQLRITAQIVVIVQSV